MADEVPGKFKRSMRFLSRHTPATVRWFLANIFLPLLPFGLVCFDRLDTPAWYYYYLFEHGELVVVAGVLSSVALLDFVGPKQRWETLGLLAFIATLFCTITSFALFVRMHSRTYSPLQVNTLSSIAFGASVFASAMCKISTRLTEVQVAEPKGDAP